MHFSRVKQYKKKYIYIFYKKIKNATILIPTTVFICDFGQKQHLGIMLYDPVLTVLWTLKCLDGKPPRSLPACFQQICSIRYSLRRSICLPAKRPPRCSSEFVIALHTELSCIFLFLSYLLLSCRLVSGCRVQIHKKIKKFHCFVPHGNRTTQSILCFLGGWDNNNNNKKSCLLCTQADDPKPTSLSNFPALTIFSTQPGDPLDPVACGPFADKDSLPRAPESLFPPSCISRSIVILWAGVIISPPRLLPPSTSASSPCRAR